MRRYSDVIKYYGHRLFRDASSESSEDEPGSDAYYLVLYKSHAMYKLFPLSKASLLSIFAIINRLALGC